MIRVKKINLGGKNSQGSASEENQGEMINAKINKVLTSTVQQKNKQTNLKTEMKKFTRITDSLVFT